MTELKKKQQYAVKICYVYGHIVIQKEFKSIIVSAFLDMTILDIEHMKMDVL